MKTVLAILVVLFSSLLSASGNPRLGKSSREDKNGWIYVHLEGKPADIGYQHGYLLAPEIDDALKMFSHFLEGSTKKDWGFYREAAAHILWPKLEKEYQDEIEGIAEGLRAKGYKYDKVDITALNGWMELAQYYLPALMEKTKPGSGNNKAPGNCSAFIATGSYTEDGKIVMAHNAWVDYIVGERWNVVLDIVPEHGHRIMMDSFPGFIDSGDDFVINDGGILYTETTITQFKGFDEKGTPEFMRARKAGQYANSIDDFVTIMTTDNNGAYANTWLVGDLKTNEIAKLDLGLKHHHLWRTKDGVYVGSNFATDKEILADETTFDVNNKTSSPNARKIRWEQLVNQNKGKIDANLAKMFEGDHIDANLGTSADNRCVICGHVDEDPVGSPEWDWPPYYPGGSVQGKVTTAALAKELAFWARMGHPCGADFIASTFLQKHPEYKWMSPYLRDMKAEPWTLFEAKNCCNCEFRIANCGLTMDAEQLKHRTKKMSLVVFRLAAAIPHGRETDVIVKQIIRSSSSVAANYRAACKARSKADFISKIGIVEEEADETAFWLEYLVDLSFVDREKAEPLMKEIKELVAIFTASGRTAKQNRTK